MCAKCAVLKNIKKIFAAVFAMTIVLALLSQSVVFAESTAFSVEIGNQNALAGEVVTVPVSIKNNPGIWGLDLEITYDSAVLTPVIASDSSAAFQPGTVFDSGYLNGPVKNDVFSVTITPNKLENYTGDGVIVYLKFTVNETAKAGAVGKIEFSGVNDSSFIDIDGNDVKPQYTNGSVTVEEKTVEPADFSMNNISGKPGETVDVAISVAKNPGLWGGVVKIQYDGNVLEPVTDKDGSVVVQNGTVFDSGCLAGPAENNVISISIAPNKLENYTSNGVMFILSFKIKDTAAADETAAVKFVDYVDDSIIDIDGENVKINYTDAVVTVLKKAEPVKINIGNGQARPGNEVYLPVKLDKNCGIRGGKLYFSLDSDMLQPLLDENGQLKMNLSGKLSNIDVTAQFVDDNTICIDFSSADRHNFDNNGLIAHIGFVVKTTARPTSPVKIKKSDKNSSITDETEKEPEMDVTYGDITVDLSAVYGDVNLDGVVNSKDTLILRKKMSGMGADVDFLNADTNSDFVISTKDLLAIRKHLAGMKVAPWD